MTPTLSQSNVEILLDSCPEDESIFIWYGVLWDAMLEENHPWADGVKWLIDNNKRPNGETAGKRYESCVDCWEFHTTAYVDGIEASILPNEIVDKYKDWHPKRSISEVIRGFLEAYLAVYGKVNP